MQELLDDIARGAALRPTAPAFLDARGGIVMTHQALVRHVEQRAASLALAGVTTSDVIAYGVRPNADGIAWLLACFRAGVAVILLDPAVRPSLLAAQCRRAGATAVLLDPLVATMASSSVGRWIGARRGVSLPDSRSLAPRVLVTGPAPGGATRLRISAGAGSVPRPAWLPDNTALVIFTSGTTQAPRGVVHTAGSLAANLSAVGALADLTPDSRVLGNAAHLLIPALLAGGSVVMPPRNPRELARATRATGVTHLTFAPHQAVEWAEAGGPSPALRRLFLGSAPLRSAALHRIVRAIPNDVQIWGVYGMTEQLLVAAVSAGERLAHDERDGDLVGSPIAGTIVRIADDDEVRVSGPGRARGYLGESPLDEVRTGDLGRLDGTGRLVLLGRRKEMLIRRGQNIYPTLYEPAVVEHGRLAEAALVGVPDAVGDERVVLWIVPRSGERPDAAVANVRRLLSGSASPMDDHARPDDVFAIASLPRAGRSGKVDRGALVALAAERLAGGRRFDPLLADRA